MQPNPLIFKFIVIVVLSHTPSACQAWANTPLLPSRFQQQQQQQQMSLQAGEVNGKSTLEHMSQQHRWNELKFIRRSRGDTTQLFASIFGDARGGVGVGTKAKETNNSSSSSIVGEIFSLSANERLVNILQLPILLTLAGLIRTESISRLIANLLRIFPYSAMHDYEKLSIINWSVHYTALVYNVGIFLRLFYGDGSSSAGTTRKKRIYAICATGLGQIFGAALMLSHSLIGFAMPPSSATATAGQSLYNFAHSSMKFSTMAIGPLLLLSKSLFIGISASFLIGYATLKGLVSFGNLPGIVLSNSGLIALLISSENDFSPMFKLSHFLYSFMPVIATLIGRFIAYEGTDLGHSLGALVVTTFTIFQRWALIRDDQNRLRKSEE